MNSPRFSISLALAFILLSCVSSGISQSASAQSHSQSQASSIRSTNAPVADQTTNTSGAPDSQQVTPDDPAKAAEKIKTERIHALLDRAYVLTEQLSPEKKLEVLSDIMYIAQDRYPQTSLEWARDLWNTARLLPEDAVLDEEGSAVKAISRVDPDMALAMLMQMKVSGFTTAFGRHVPVGQGALGMTALEVFDFMQRKYGSAALPKLQAATEAMGKNGAYPYRAMCSMLIKPFFHQVHAAPKDAQPIEDADKQRAIEIFTSAFRAHQTAPKGLNDVEFAEFLTKTWQYVPHDQAREAVNATVRTLLATEPDPNQTGNVKVGDKLIRFGGRSNYALIQLIPLVKQLDPALFTQAVQARPELADAQEGRFSGLQGGFIGVPPERMTPEMRQWMERRNARQADMFMAVVDPDRALGVAAGMSDLADKADLMAAVATSLAVHSPEEAARSLDQALKVEGDLQDPMQQLRVIVSATDAARALKQKQRVQELMARGFKLGAQLMRSQADEQPGSNGQVDALSYMNALVASGMADDPDGVTQVIDGVEYPLARAKLYSTAAHSLAFDSPEQ